MFLDEMLENVGMDEEPHSSHRMTQWKQTI